jgi:glycosyltransferase involved in cell wall biosynthesis
LKKYAISVVTRGIGGAGVRFVYLYQYLCRTFPAVHIDLIINKTFFQSLSKKGIHLDSFKNVIVLNDKGKSGSLLYKIFFIKYIFYMAFNFHKYEAVHFISAAKIALLPCRVLRAIFFRKKIRLGMTFASNSIEMACYNRKKGKVLEGIYLKSADYIDQLNKVVFLKKNVLRKSFFSPCSFITRDDFEYKDSYDLKEDSVCFLGVFDAIKNPLLLAKAMSFVFVQKPDVKFYFIGNGPLHQDILAIKKNLNEQNRQNVFVGFIDSPSALLKKTKIFCSLQTFTNYPSQALLEAMFAKNYVIATDTGDTKELLSGNWCHLLRENTSQELANVILDFLSKSYIEQEELASVTLDHVKHFARIDVFADYFVHQCLRAES